MAGCKSSIGVLELHETTVLLKEPGIHNIGQPEKEIEVIPVGSTVTVIFKEYGKDYLAYEVETKEGLTGYVVHSKKMTFIVD